MDKPHYIFRQNVELNQKRIQSIGSNVAREYDELYNLFSVFKQEITSEQISKVKYYWGNF